MGGYLEMSRRLIDKDLRLQIPTTVEGNGAPRPETDRWVQGVRAPASLSRLDDVWGRAWCAWLLGARTRSGSCNGQ